MRVNKKTISTRGNKEIKYTHIHNKSQVICFMFSGAGYTYDKPLLYYSTMMMLENHVEVVHIHYAYSQKELDLPEEKLADLMVEDANSVVTNVTAHREYKKVIFLGKSLGTIPIISAFAKDHRFLNSKMIILTPLLQHPLYCKRLLESLKSTLIIIGSKDQHYIPEKVSQFAAKDNFTVKEIPEGNHSLEIDPFNTFQSISVVNEILTMLNHFIFSEEKGVC
jgi:predicted alpha/beta-hydrolase family hydrolase